jgi:hypothetical protein
MRNIPRIDQPSFPLKYKNPNRENRVNKAMNTDTFGNIGKSQIVEENDAICSSVLSTRDRIIQRIVTIVIAIDEDK